MSDLEYGREALGDLRTSSRLEWLVTNGIGGFASGTISGVLARRYHGLLFAALKPPLGRTLLLSKLAEQIEIDGRTIDLDTNVWSSGVVSPAGHLQLESFRLDGTIPTWTFAIGDVRLEKRVWMEQGENTTYVQYRVLSSPGPQVLRLKALVNHRDSHALTARGAGAARVEPATGGLRIEAGEGATPLWLLALNAEFRPAQDWYRGFSLALEHERGLDSVEDHLCVGEILTRLVPGESFTVVASTRRDAGTGEAAPLALISALARRRAHEKNLTETWKRAQPAAARNAPDWIRQLVLAADAFLVERSTVMDPNGRTVIAGYPWFSDWGRDTMVALPGLTLATGRPEIARAILTTFARHVDQGMLPNYFPDHGEKPQYDTVDASLWYFQAVRAYYDTTRDDTFLAEVYPVLEDIGAWYERGTRYGVQVDPNDALLRAGEPGSPLTWMDARVDGEIVTPRHGKPVEINALWYNALTTMAFFARKLKRSHEAYESLADRVKTGFARYWHEPSRSLIDVLDGPDPDDRKIRPNQIFAVSLPDSPLPAPQRRAVVETCGRLLVTSHGLRSLEPSAEAYRGTYLGDARRRDAAYHQGTVWTWLLPHYVIAHERVYGDRDRALGFLEPLGRLSASYGIGTLGEIADGDAPHLPRGCIAQAWSVAEALRAYHALAIDRRGARPRVRSRALQAAERV